LDSKCYFIFFKILPGLLLFYYFFMHFKGKLTVWLVPHVPAYLMGFYSWMIFSEVSYVPWIKQMRIGLVMVSGFFLLSLYYRKYTKVYTVNLHFKQTVQFSLKSIYVCIRSPGNVLEVYTFIGQIHTRLSTTAELSLIRRHIGPLLWRFSFPNSYILEC
jgi:hypothetical protein